MERLWTLANGIMLLLFLFSAVVQVNDPDPLVWIGIYVAAAVVCGLEARRRTPAWAPLALSLVALFWAGSLHAGARDVPISALFAQWEMRDFGIEEAREMYGLAIVGAWMLLIAGARLARVRRRLRHGGVEEGRPGTRTRGAGRRAAGRAEEKSPR